jgi:hypothetical protein
MLLDEARPLRLKKHFDYKLLRKISIVPRMRVDSPGELVNTKLLTFDSEPTAGGHLAAGVSTT